MFEDSDQSPGPLQREDLRHHDEARVFDNKNGYLTDRDRGRRNKSTTIDRSAVIPRSAMDPLVSENYSLARENQILRKFLMLKKENCDLKTLDIITNALTMCDEKLNEFILNLYRSSGQRKLVSFADIYGDKNQEENTKPDVNNTIRSHDSEKLRSPSYGTPFKEVRMSELDTLNDSVFLSNTDETEQQLVNKQGYNPTPGQLESSGSYGRSFQEVRPSELETLDTSAFTRGGSTGRRHQSQGGLYDSRLDDSYNVRHDDTSTSYGKSFRQLDMDELREDGEYSITINQENAKQQPLDISIHKETRFTTASPRSVLSHSPRAVSIPVVNKPQGSPKQRSSTPTKPSTFKPIQQPHMRFSMETPRQYPKKQQSPVNNKDSESRRKSRIPVIPRRMGDKFTIKTADVSARSISDQRSPGSVLYDSLEQTDREDEKFISDAYFSAQSDATVTNRSVVDNHRTIKTPEGIGVRLNTGGVRPGVHTNPLNRQVTVPVVNRRASGPPSMAQTPATGNVGNSPTQTARPIYVNSGQQRETNFLPFTATAHVDSESPIQYKQGNTLGQYQHTVPSPYAQSRLNHTFDQSTGTERGSDTMYVPVTKLVTRQGQRDERIVGNEEPQPSVGQISRASTRTNESTQTGYQRPHQSPVSINEGVPERSDPNYNQKYETDDDSMWVNITTHAKVLNADYDSQPGTREFREDITVTGDKVSVDATTAGTMKSFGSPLHTSTPVQSYRTKQKRFNSGQQTNGSPQFDELIRTPDRGYAHATMGDHRVQAQINGYPSGNTTKSVKIDNTSSDSRRQFDESLLEAVQLKEPKPGDSEKVKSVIYRPVDILTGYTTQVTQDMTHWVMGSKPSRRLIGEIAFQLDRRIMEMVIGRKASFSGKGFKQSRYYGYSLVNITHLIQKESLDVARGDPDLAQRVKQSLVDRLDNINEMLGPLGYDPSLHPEFAQDMVNRYGLMKEAPGRDSVIGVGLREPVVLRMLLGRLLGQGHLLSNMLVLLDCLCYLSYSDNYPLFMW